VPKLILGGNGRTPKTLGGIRRRPDYDRTNKELYVSLTRRRLLQRSLIYAKSMTGGMLLAGCRSRFVQVSPIVPVPRETTPAEADPSETPIRAVPTLTPQRDTSPPAPASPAPRAPRTIIADVSAYGWTQFARSRTSEFARRYPEIRIEWRNVLPWPIYFARVAALQASGDPADLLEAPFGVPLAHWVRMQTIAPLDDLLRNQAFPLDGIFSSAIQACSVAGRLMGIPLFADPGDALLLYHRPTLAKQLITPQAEWNLTDLEELATQAHQEKKGLYGLGLQANMPGASALLHLFGGSLLTTDGRRCAVARDESIECLAWLQNMIYARRAAPSPQVMVRGALDMLYRGQLGMLRGSLSDLSNARRLLGTQPKGRQTPMNVEATLFPAHPDTHRRAGTINGIAYCLGAYSRAGDDVLRWIAFMTSIEAGVDLFLGDYAMPGARGEAWRHPRVFGQEPVVSALADMAEIATRESMPWNEWLGACYEAWNRHVNDLLERRSDPDTCAKSICDDLRSILQRPQPPSLVMP
jgi:ABC-type glycerol-3-phosphate transport system substrate-binding protein